MDNENRVRIVYLEEHLIVDILNWMDNPDQFLSIHDGCGLPDGTRVLRVRNDFERRAIVAMVQHDSFDRVSPGCRAPEHPVDNFSRRVIRKQRPDGVVNVDAEHQSA